ncbi:hypothetical protein EDD18DRAFT_1106496 [Armillaria luteobubalina]|uniref:Uncharacterized protein n=1 Tax=Armillaria luteobubalina TaxID=153913 RepID=A0AA39USB7_9AGAR|nr:hypothetical protein EDD18DRAFT_1106496 [Armillaria luteobubalina]
MSSPLFIPGTPIPPDDTPTGNLAYTLPPAASFPQIQCWTKLGTAINLSNLVKNSCQNLTLQKMNESYPKCWSTDAITFFVIPFNPKPLLYLTTIHKLTHLDTEAGVRGVTGVVQIAIQNSPKVIAFITANRDTILSSFFEKQAIASIVNSVEVQKIDLIVAGGYKEQMWDGMDQFPAQQVISILPQWLTLIPFKSLTFTVPPLVRPKQTEDKGCKVDLEDPEVSEEAGGSTMDCTSD